MLEALEQNLALEISINKPKRAHCYAIFAPCDPTANQVCSCVYGELSTLLKCLQDLKPDIVYARISGYGQTGPKSQLAGYASVCEAYGGFRYSTHASPCYWRVLSHVEAP